MALAPERAREMYRQQPRNPMNDLAQKECKMSRRRGGEAPVRATRRAIRTSARHVAERHAVVLRPRQRKHRRAIIYR